MSTPIQKLESIGALSGDCEGMQDGPDQPKTQSQKDYEEGRGYVERGEAALAAVALHNALRGSEEEGNREGMANALNQLGHACLMRQEYDKAVINYKKAWEICEELEDPYSIPSLAKQMAEAYQGAGDYRMALNLCLDLLDGYQRNNDPMNTVAVLERMASIYIDSGEKEKAADAYKTAASIHRNFRHAKSADSLEQKAAELVKDAE